LQWADVGIKLISALAQIGITAYVAYKTSEALQHLINNKKDGDVAKIKRDLALRLRRPEIEVMDMNGHEARLALDCIGSDDIDVCFDDIGGMKEQLEVVKDNLILPMQMSRMHQCKGMLACPTGALLYGRPGTGKTMTAKALAKEAKATFINVKASSIMDKWLGESDKMAAAIFSLSRKLAPTIIFIDEIDTLLKNRDRGHNEAHATMQGVFLAEWDGLGTSTNKPVVVLGATNRPQDLDKAFLRRMPVMIHVPPPDQRGREDILKRQLASEVLDSDVSLEEVALRTDGFTGSDLRELVRTASLQRAKQMVADLGSGSGIAELRRLHMRDFEFALSKTQKTGKAADEYAMSQHAVTVDLGALLKGLLGKGPKVGGEGGGGGEGSEGNDDHAA